MKKTIFIAATLLVAGFAQAQDEKMWLSGSANFRNYNDDGDTKITGGNFSPAFGYYINPKIAVGISLNISGQKQEEDDGNNETIEYTTSEFSVQPFFRYYKSVGEKCSLYGEVYVGFGAGKTETEGADNEDTYGFLQTGIAPGIQYWFHNRWSVNAEWGALSYRADNDKGDGDGEDDFKSSEFNVGLDLSAISFGLNFHF